jgi:hypothetical protein
MGQFFFKEEISEVLPKKFVVLHVKCLISFSDFEKNCILSTCFNITPQCKFEWELSSMQAGRQVDGRTDRQPQSIVVTVRTRLKLCILLVNITYHVNQQNALLKLIF